MIGSGSGTRFMYEDARQQESSRGRESKVGVIEVDSCSDWGEKFDAQGCKQAKMKRSAV